MSDRSVTGVYNKILLKKQKGIDSSIVLLRNKNNTEIPHIVFPFRDSLVQDDTIELKRLRTISIALLGTLSRWTLAILRF